MDLHGLISPSKQHVSFTCHFSHSDTHFLSCQHASAAHFSPSRTCTDSSPSTSAEHSAPSFQSHLFMTDTSLVLRSLGLLPQSVWSLTGRNQLPAQSAFSTSYFQNHTGVCQAVPEEKLPRPGLLMYVLQSNRTTAGFLQAMTHQEKEFFWCTKITAEVGFTVWTTASKNLLHFHYANIIQVHL